VLLDLLFPPVCLGCGVLLRDTTLPPCCSRCVVDLHPLPSGQRTVFTSTMAGGGITALYAYDGPLARALGRLKYHGDLGWVGPLARILAQADDLEAGSPWDAIVPVPLHPRRLWARGFDHALVLVRAAARCRGRAVTVRVRPGLLRRIRAAPPQASLDRTRRRTNLDGAFEVPPRSTALVRGRRILLVDDVTTTGATLEAAGTALSAAGAACVGALALMRTLA
jgi:ComF family protein